MTDKGKAEKIRLQVEAQAEAQAEAPVEAQINTPVIDDDEVQKLLDAVFEEHMHVHVHEDGKVHNHYHRHPAGNFPHEHAPGSCLDHVHYGDSHLPKSPVAGDDHVFDDKEAPIHSHGHIRQSKTILEVADVSYRYPNQTNLVFEGISFEAKAGSILAILGNNGAGKSTLLNVLAGIARPSHGRTLITTSDISKMNRKEIARHIAYVSQEHRIPHLSVYDQVLLGRKPHIMWSVSEYDRLVVSNTIEQLGLKHFATRFIDELSGGERQKVHIARAIAQEPEVLLLDEPTSALDPKNQMEVLEIVREITDQGSLATIIVMHDINLALRFCDRFIMMHDGSIVSYGGSEVVTDETLTKTYDYAMRIKNIDGTRVAVPTKKKTC